MCLLAIVPSAVFAEVQLKINAQNISVDDTFDISITSDKANVGNIDTSGITKNFEILDNHKQTSMSIINGQVSQSTTWIYTVAAKKSGKITIPPITVGNENTQAIEIDIKQGSGQADIILEADVEPSTAYVQGQFIYIQRLLFARSFRSNPTLTRPRLTKGRAEIEVLGNTSEQIVQRNGRDYRVFTRRFAIIPQESGTLILAPSVFSGTLRATGQNYNSRSRRIRVKSKEISVNIKPRPSEFTGKDWIVAKDFSLHLNWPVPPDQLKAGEPVTVVLAAIADGLRAEQLPDINLKAPKGIKLYPEKSVFDNIKSLDGIVGTMNKSIVLIATGGGEFTLPELKIPWWNSQTEKQEVAVIKAVKLKISGTPAATPIQKALPDPKKEEKPIEADDNKQQSIGISNTLLIIITLVSLLLLLALAWLYKNWKKKSPDHTVKRYTAEDQRKILHELKQVCEHNNAQAAKPLLEEWMRCTGYSLSENYTKLNQAINKLNHALYAKANTPWQGKRLWRAIEDYHFQQSQAEKAEDNNTEYLEPLYLSSHAKSI